MSDNSKNKMVCLKAFNNIEVHPNGDIYPCCPEYVNGFSFGNIFEEQDFEKIWNSTKAQSFRNSILNKTYSYCNLGLCRFKSITQDNNYGLSLKVKAYPEIIKFSHEVQCNVCCITCRDKQYFTESSQIKNLNSMIDPMFLPMLKNAKIVWLNGSGEIFAGKHCRTLVKAIVNAYPDLKFGIHSNGLLFDKKNCDELGITNRIDCAEISIHAATKKTYDKIVRGSDFEKVMNNIRWLVSLKNEGKIKCIRLDFVITSLNYKEMVAFQKLANNLNVNTSFTTFRPWGSELSKKYNSVAIFESFHPKYNDFVKVLSNQIFMSPNCSLQNSLRGLKKVSKCKTITINSFNRIKKALKIIRYM